MAETIRNRFGGVVGNHGRPTVEDRMKMKDVLKSLTKEEREFIGLVRKGRNDPVFFVENLLGLRLHDGQKVWLWMTTRTCPEQAFEAGVKLGHFKDREAFDALREKNPDFGRNILVPSNRWGKTLVTSVKHIWFNFYKVGARGSPQQVSRLRCGTLNLSPHSNQCQASYDYILDILSSRFVYVFEGTSYVNECRIEDFYVSDSAQRRMIVFKNGTSYRAVPTGEDQASSIAGTPYLFISYDECAQSLHLKAELPAKIMSRLIDFGGPLDLVSTPEVDKPSHQYFFHIAKEGLKGNDGWWTLVGKISDNVFLGTEERERIGRSIKSADPAKYRQVMFGEFVTTGKKMFDNILIERLWDSFVPPPTLHQHQYILSADWGFADTGDPTVFYVIDYTDAAERSAKGLRDPVYRVAFRESIRGGSPFAVLTRAKILQREWNGAKFIHDSGSMGGVIIKKMLHEMEMGAIIDFSANGDKADMLFCLLLVMTAGRRTKTDEEGKVEELNPDFGRLRSYHIPELEEQMGNYQYNPDKGVTDKKLEQDDIMSLGQAIWWLERKLVKTSVTSVNFNPLAPGVEQMIAVKDAGRLRMREITVPERRIL